MDYHKMFFSKPEMSQTVPNSEYTADSYADNFDLSLLPPDGEVPLSPQSNYNQQSQFVSSLDYIPATIYNDQPMKIERNWSSDKDNIGLGKDNNIVDSNTTAWIQQFHKQYQFYPSPLPSPPQDSSTINTTIFPPSPQSPTYDPNFQIKQEFHALPPSPPESNGVPSPYHEIKSEPEHDSEALIDINSLLEKSLKEFEEKEQQQPQQQLQQPPPPPQDHQLLREYLQDTSFQKKHNLKPLALESLIGGLGTCSDIEPVISLALEHAKRDAQAMCATLKISPDPTQWSTSQVHAWLRSTTEQFKLPKIENLELKFPEDGSALTCLTEEEFNRRVPEAGSTIHAQLEVWKLACSENFSTTMIACDPTTSSGMPCTWGGNEHHMQSLEMSEDEDEEMHTVAPGPSASTTIPVTKTGRSGGSHIHLWQFLKELLSSPQQHGTAIRWLDRSKGVFKIEDSVRVAKLWGRRKNRPAMNYDKLSRSIRQYYKKGIMKKTERSQRLVYQFCHPYCL